MTHLFPTTGPQSNRLATAMRELVVGLMKTPVPAIDYAARPYQFQDVATHIRAVAMQVDAWMRVVGDEVNASSTVKIDRDLFRDIVLGAVDGDAAAAIDRLAEDMEAARAPAGRVSFLQAAE